MSLNTLELNQEELEEQLIQETKADLNDMEKEIHTKVNLKNLEKILQFRVDSIKFLIKP